MFGGTGGIFVPLSNPPFSVLSPGNVPVALGRLPTHPPLPPHLAFRHPVAATPLAGQEEVTAVSPLPPLFPHPACHELGKRPRDQQGCHLTQLGPQPRRRGSHRAPIVTVTLRVSPAPPGWRRDRPPVGGWIVPTPQMGSGGIPLLLRTGGHHGDTVTAPVPTDQVHQALGHLNLPELKLPLQPSPACPAAGGDSGVTAATALRPGHPAGTRMDTVAATWPCQVPSMPIRRVLVTQVAVPLWGGSWRHPVRAGSGRKPRVPRAAASTPSCFG